MDVTVKGRKSDVKISPEVEIPIPRDFWQMSAVAPVLLVVVY